MFPRAHRVPCWGHAELAQTGRDWLELALTG